MTNEPYEYEPDADDDEHFDHDGLGDPYPQECYVAAWRLAATPTIEQAAAAFDDPRHKALASLLRKQRHARVTAPVRPRCRERRAHTPARRRPALRRARARSPGSDDPDPDLDLPLSPAIAGAAA